MSENGGIDATLGRSNRGLSMNFNEPASSSRAAQQVRTEQDAQQTATEKLSEAPTTADMLSGKEETSLSATLTKEGTLYTKTWGQVDPNNSKNSTSGSFAFGQYHFKPDLDVTEDWKDHKVDVGISGELTEAQVKQKVVNGPMTAQATGTLNTVNGVLKIEGQASLKKESLNGGVTAGGEAMVLDGKLEATVKITPKSIIDEVAEAYNNRIDPLVDAISGTDMPGIPEAPDSWDKGVIISGHVEGGVGAALKGKVMGGFKNNIPSLEVGGKAGVGLVGGFNGKIEGTW